MSVSIGNAVFVSYASQDAEAARRICEALRAAGVEVWFDQNELVGGDAWDAKIRGQIAACALFVPLISANTQARREGYFRLEWKLAAQRTHMMSERNAFVLPVVIDDTRDADGDVPGEFKAVQWTRLMGGETPPAFVTRVQKLLGGTSAPTAAVAPPAPTSVGSPRASKSRLPVGLAAALIIGVLFFIGYRATRPLVTEPAVAPKVAADVKAGAAPATAPFAASNDKSVAVLPFENRSGDKGDEYFSDGISDELLNVLGRVAGLRVVARTSAFSFKGKNVTAHEIGRALNVAHLVEGSVQRVGTRVRIMARLIRAESGDQVWSDRFDTEAKDIFAAQDEIANAIARQLSLTLGAPARPAKTVNPEAHRLVLEGRYFYNARTPKGFSAAEEAFTRAIGLAPDFAEAHAGLGFNLVTRASYNEIDGFPINPGEMARGEQAALRSIELDPSLPDGYSALGYGLLNDGNFGEAERRLLQTIALNSNSAVARKVLGLIYSCTGRLELAIVEHEKADSLDPLNDQNILNLVQVLWWAGRLNQALAAVERSIALRADAFIMKQGLRAQILLALGRTTDAVVEARFVRDHPELSPRLQSDPIAVRVLLEAGFKAEADEYAAQLFARWSPDHYQRGFVLTALGRFDEAIPHLERTVAQPGRYLFWDRIFDPYRNDPRFLTLLTKLGRSEHYQVARETHARLGKP